MLVLDTRVRRRFGVLLDWWIWSAFDVQNSLSCTDRYVWVLWVSHLELTLGVKLLIEPKNLLSTLLFFLFFFYRKKEGPKVNSYFSHSGSILKVLSLLGIAKDPAPLLASNYHIHKYRVWKTSYIDAFATNIAFVLFKWVSVKCILYIIIYIYKNLYLHPLDFYSCESDGPSILTLHQERPVWLPGCPENRPCPLSMMKQLYPDNDEECNFDDICTECKKTQ